jgi:hypothetical protein
MAIVRPNVRTRRRCGLTAPGCALVLAVAGCSSTDHRAEIPADSAATPRRAAAPSAYVSDIPAWPADTTTSATDRDGVLPARLKAKVPSCGAATPVVTADSIGPFYPGQPVANLFGACAHLLQLWAWDDGKYLPAVALRVGDALLLLEVNGVMPEAVVTRVAALEGARTREGVGSGSSLADAAGAFGAPTWRRDQCAVGAAFASRPGLVIRVAIPQGQGDTWTCEQIRRFGTGPDFSRFPKGSTVASLSAELDAAP